MLEHYRANRARVVKIKLIQIEHAQYFFNQIQGYCLSFNCQLKIALHSQFLLFLLQQIENSFEEKYNYHKVQKSTSDVREILSQLQC